MKIKIYMIITLFLFGGMFFLYNCGDDDAEPADTTTTTTTTTIATTTTTTVSNPPTVVSITPADETLRVEGSSNIEITFDAELNTSVTGTVTFTTPAVSFVDGANCSMTVSGTSVTIDPDTDLTKGKVYSNITIEGFESAENVQMTSYNDADYNFMVYLGNVNLTNDAGASVRPSAVWNGNDIAVAWDDDRDGQQEIYFARYDEMGNIIGSETRITNTTSQAPEIVWTGTEYGITWHDGREGDWEVYFARLSSTGSMIGSELKISDTTNHSIWPKLIYTGSEYMVVWAESGGFVTCEIVGQRISSTGTKEGGLINVTSNDSSESTHPSLVWTGTEYGIAWHDGRDGNHEIYFQRISSTGSLEGTNNNLINDSGSQGYPSIVWNGSEYGIAWQDDRDIGSGPAEIYFMELNGTGTPIGTPLRVTNATDWSTNASLVWTGTEYGVSWKDERHTSGEPEIYFARIDNTGALVGSEVRITDAADKSESVSLVWTGNLYGMFWQDNRDTNYEIYYAAVDPTGQLF